MSSANRFASLAHQTSKVASPKQPDEYENSFPSLSESTEIPKKFKPETVERTNSKKTKVVTKFILAPRSYEEEMRLLRANAYDTLSDKEKIGKSLIKTRMCHSVEKKEPCSHGDNCRFAHDLNELNVSDCLFHDKCYFVRMHNGVLCNLGEKICRHKHPQETKENVFLRTGICQNESHIPTPQEPTLMLLTNSTPKTLNIKETSSVIRVPKELAIRALEIAMENGKTHIHIEIIE
jgi:hypothetical protein